MSQYNSQSYLHDSLAEGNQTNQSIATRTACFVADDPKGFHTQCPALIKSPILHFCTARLEQVVTCQPSHHLTPACAQRACFPTTPDVLTAPCSCAADPAHHPKRVSPCRTPAQRPVYSPRPASRDSSVVPNASAAHSSACGGFGAAPDAPAASWWVCGGVHGQGAEADPLQLATSLCGAAELCGGRWSGSSASSVACTAAALGRAPGSYAVQERQRSTTPCGHSSGTLQKKQVLSLTRA